MALLTIGSMFFSSDANKLVLEPIERMTEEVKNLARNPIGAINNEMENAGVLTLATGIKKQGTFAKK